MVAGDVEVRRLSPYDDTNHLWNFVAPDWFPDRGVTREVAMSIPAVKRARRTIAHGVASLPMHAYRGDDVAAHQPVWLDRTDGPISPYHRLLWTTDDLIFYGWSAWAVERDDDSGLVVAADRIPFDRWSIDDQGRVLYRHSDGTETPAREDSVILIPGSDEGLLATPSVVRHAAHLLDAAAKAAETPAAHIELHQTNDLPIADSDRQKIIDSWVKARRGENGGVAFTSAGIEAKEHGTFDAHLLVEGRNAAALDIARAMGVPGSVVDATVDKASLNYETAESKARDLIDYGLSAYMLPISARLSMNDVVGPGLSVRFDLEEAIGPGATAGSPDDGGHSTAPTAPASKVPADSTGGQR